MNDLIEKLNGLEPYLSSRIKGQAHVTPRVCSVLERGQLDLQPPGKPLGSFLFLGPTGVGKTELTLEFSRYLFGNDAVFRFDMSEFLHLDAVKLFMGDESGRPGRLGTVLSEQRQGVLLFDEIEKAHRLIWDLFLQMLGAARITLADHRTYDLSGFYIVCTSNIGSQQLLRPTRLPFATLERAVLSELHRVFRPELIGRFDEKIVFKPLSVETQWEIGRLVVSEEIARFRAKGIELTVSEEAFEFLVRRGIHKTLGARPMKKTMQKLVGDAIRDMLKCGVRSPGVIVVSPTNDRLMISASESKRLSLESKPSISAPGSPTCPASSSKAAPAPWPPPPPGSPPPSAEPSPMAAPAGKSGTPQPSPSAAPPPPTTSTYS
jgi:ATP-dependent Clp protease ATP-binding subunit ClpA